MQTIVNIKLKNAVKVEIVDIKQRKILPNKVLLRITAADNTPTERWYSIGETWISTINLDWQNGPTN